ncbi:hypothetical protein [Prevotella sp. HUN102]|uniref:hypothetical protein n=1 Tax=Prevotella sp. HUN102 TaxID=1392486 RepID=UPI0004901765|nr:hypothetical protein [Prevotella sp. HUN102]
MRKNIVLAFAVLILLSSCGTFTGSGAFTGSSIGSVLGSAIGGIAGGQRGSDVGTIIGMAGGAVIGATVGAQADKKEKERIHDRYEQIQHNKSIGYNPYGSNVSVIDENGFDSTNSGDDRMYDFQNSNHSGNYSIAPSTRIVPSQSTVGSTPEAYGGMPNVEISNVSFVDDNQDGVLSRGEIGKIVFEIRNLGSQTLYNVEPSVVEIGKHRRINISPSIHIGRFDSGSAVRYTAIIQADKKLKNGECTFALTVLQGQKSISRVIEFKIPTRK